MTALSGEWILGFAYDLRRRSAISPPRPPISKKPAAGSGIGGGTSPDPFTLRCESPFVVPSFTIGHWKTARCHQTKMPTKQPQFCRIAARLTGHFSRFMDNRLVSARLSGHWKFITANHSVANLDPGCSKSLPTTQATNGAPYA